MLANVSLAASGKVSIPDIAPKELFKIGAISFTETMLTTLVVVAFLLLFAAFIRIFLVPRWKNSMYKSGFRIFIEYLVNIFDGSSNELTGRNARFIGPMYFAMSGFLCLGTLIEVVGLRPVISDLNAALSMGIITFVMVFSLGFKEKKVRRLLHYINPLNILSDVVVPFSLALRMFGSVLSGFIIMHLIYSLPPFVLVGIPVIGTFMFTIFHALIQSYIFMFLSMSFINEATEVEPRIKKVKIKKDKKEKVQKQA